MVDQGNRWKSGYRSIWNEMAWEERMHNGEEQIKAKIANPGHPG